MREARAGRVNASGSLDPLAQLRRRLVRIATAADIVDSDTAQAIHSLDAKTMIDQFPESLMLKDRRGRFVFVNASALASLGCQRIEDLFGKTEFDLYDLPFAEERFQIEQEVMSLGVTREQEELLTPPDGRQICLLTTRTPLRDDQGAVVGIIVMSRDISERKRQQDLQRGHASVLEMVARGRPLQAILETLCHVVQQQLEGVYASVLLMEEEGNCLRHGASPTLPVTYTQLIDGLEVGPRVGSCGTAAWRRTSVVVRDIETDPLWANFRDIAAVFGLRSCWSTPILGTSRQVIGTFALYSSEVREPTERELEVTSMATDLAGIAIERAMNEQRIQYMAHHDPLTGLPNRALFWPQFSRALHTARRESRKVTVAYIDLDNFKQINDAHGHAAGDELLKVISQRISQSIRASDLVVRLGGDEFAIVFSNSVQDEASVLRRLREIRTMISQPVEIDGGSLQATCSMGVAFFPRDGNTPEELLARADKAMYEAKAHGRDTLEVAREPVSA
ncbi:diguanylate cyclase [Rhizobium sp. FY34]|uniref:sensor domain-containing protein n=1 Tax=Rhizobium sp. FY34 TaxID=2562309 RepID=UPI00148576A7|nr:diguanylate cyclase [Rhizobium sp. FY34]